MTAKVKKLSRPPKDSAMSRKAIEDIEEPEQASQEEEDESESFGKEDETEEGVPLSDLESLEGNEDVDIVPYQKLFKDNHAALTQALSTFALPLDTLPFHIHQSITSSQDVTIDVNDDLNRELAFYKQALEAAQEGRRKLLTEGVSFSRPSDYFAEMIKDDEHMEKVREKIINEEAAKKASEAAKRQRDLKKFGKQVQISKIQEREKEKRSTLEKIKALKRKRRDGNTLTTEDDFDVELEDVDTGRHKRPKMSREKRNEKYGYGGSKRSMKRNDDDAGDLSHFDKRGRGGFRGRTKGGMGKRGPQRPGKRRRMQQRK